MELRLYPIDERKLLPQSPGVYKFYTTDKVLIYVGKAKDLRKRVYSYFSKSGSHNRKTLKMVRQIAYYDFVVVDNETDALLLENNLIKEHQPKFNILLKDDKTFPYICILKEPFPRIITTRKVTKSKGEYFGPYSSVLAMNTVLDLIRKLYTIRTCKLNLAPPAINKNNYKVCLEFHIGNCLGPCEKRQSESDYLADIDSARKIIKGSLGEVKQYFKEKMIAASNKLSFEEAQRFKEKIDLVERFQTKSTIVNPKLPSLNVLTINEDGNAAYINYMHVHNGAVVTSRTLEIKRSLDESAEEILPVILFDLIKDSDRLNCEIVSNREFEFHDHTSSIPKIGDKKKLIDLSLRNALEYKKNKLLKKAHHDPIVLVLDQLKTDLGMKELPKHIECFDNSNLQGSNPVASMVCFKNGKPSKKDYRHFNIKTVIGPDDFASMYEIVSRRYRRVISENEPLPNLIVIDGGKGQLSSAVKALKDLQVYGQVPIIGIAKRLEEIYYPEDSLPLHISKKSPSLRLLQHVRDEAHRFAITFHRQKRSKNSLTTELEGIKGIGKQTADTLLKKFRSVNKISQASHGELKELLGNAKAQIIIEHFRQKKEA